MIARAMVLAAGFGKRMRPLTLTRPKPLVEVAGRALIDHVVDRLRIHGAQRVVVNMHWLGDQVAAWAASFTPPPEIVLSDETDRILDTGGGVKKALPLLGEAPFFVLNADSFWLDDEVPALDRLAAAWSDDMDCLALLCPLENAVGYSGEGDFVMDASGRLARRAGLQVGQAFTGVYLVHPRLFEKAPEGAFSMNLLWDRAIAAERMYGISHAGLWLHVGTPESITEAEQAMANWPRR